MPNVGRARLDIVGDLVIILRQPTEQMFHVALVGCIGQLPRMMGLAPEVSCAVHTFKTAPRRKAFPTPFVARQSPVAGRLRLPISNV